MTKLYFKKTKAALQLLVLLPFFSVAQINLLQTTNNTVTTAISSCGPGGNVTYLNEYARLYNLTALGYSSFQVTKVSFAIHGFQLGTAANYPVSAKVYASTGGTADANLTLVGQATVNITSAMVGTVVEVPLTIPAVVTSPAMFIVISAPNGQPTSTGFYPGANSSGQTAPGYAKATACGDISFVDIASFDGPKHIVLFPTGNPTLIPPQCPPGNVTLSTQAQVDQFIIDYPNCTQIAGWLNIQANSGTTDITNIAALSNITSISGNLEFNNNTLLTDITPLSNLTTIGGGLLFHNNGIQNINAMNSLNSLGGHLMITNNNALTNLNGLNNLTTIRATIYIKENAVLNGISALQNAALTNPVPGLGLTIVDNPALSVCNLPNFCAYLANPAGTHTRNITGNAANCLNEAAVVTACSTPQCPPGNVTLSTQAQVNQFIVDYPNCTVITGNLTIQGADIINLNGLSNIVEVTGYLGVYNNTLLQNFNGLENLTTLGISLDISNNPAILNTNGLSGLTNIGTEIQFNNNPQLQNISSLSNITATGGGIWIIQNGQLQTLNGLQNILQIGGDIDISNNAALNDITALQNIDSSTITELNGYGLTIVNNPMLSVCNLSNFCAYLANPAGTHPRDITGNAGNCITGQALTNQCNGLGIADIDTFNLSFYPNPVKGILYISGNENITSVSVINIVGQTVIAKTINSAEAQIDMASLPSGSYFVKVSAEGAVKTIKAVKQ